MKSRVKQASVVSEIGLRPRMEDRHALVEGAGGLFGGVYDGHGGVEVAELVASQLHQEFFKALEEGLAPEAAFLRSYERMDRAVQSLDCGTTAATFFIRDSEITVAHLGDARVILIGEEAAEQLTEDHRVDHPRERDRILQAGGEIEDPYVMRGTLGVMPTRVFGDRWFRPVGVIATPDVATRQLTPSDRYLVAGCDGLWDVLDNERVAGIVHTAPDARQAATTLAAAVFARGGSDNVTIIVVQFGPEE